MKKYLILLFSFLLLACGKAKNSDIPIVNLILDTDMGPDYDDVGAMTLMYALADSGQVNILATLSSNKDEQAIPCIEVINEYFKRFTDKYSASNKTQALLFVPSDFSVT